MTPPERRPQIRISIMLAALSKVGIASAKDEHTDLFINTLFGDTL